MAIKVVGIGGSLRDGSQSERALRMALAGRRERRRRNRSRSPAPTWCCRSTTPAVPERPPSRARLVEPCATADGVIIVSPGYHGALSGLVKNALDYVEDLRGDERPYLDGRAVGCVAIAFGWQAAVTTLTQLRTIVHALRGWPTPLGGAVNSAEVKFDEGGGCSIGEGASHPAHHRRAGRGVRALRTGR